MPSRDALIDRFARTMNSGCTSNVSDKRLDGTRHFGPPELALGSTDGYLLYTLSSTLRSLREQVRRELALEAARCEHAPADQAPRALEIVRKFAAALPKLRATLDTDIHAAHEGDPAAKSLDEVVFCYPGVSAIIRHRLAHELFLLGAPMLARIISEASHAQTATTFIPARRSARAFSSTTARVSLLAR